jgi:hypothetical protein
MSEQGTTHGRRDRHANGRADPERGPGELKGPRIQPNEIGVIVKDGVATLAGWVDLYVKRDAVPIDVIRKLLPQLREGRP